jgi:hypothetical protein
LQQPELKVLRHSWTGVHGVMHHHMGRRLGVYEVESRMDNLITGAEHAPQDALRVHVNDVLGLAAALLRGTKSSSPRQDGIMNPISCSGQTFPPT